MKIHCPELPQNLKEETEWAGLEAWAREEEADISGCRLTGITCLLYTSNVAQTAVDDSIAGEASSPVEYAVSAISGGFGGYIGGAGAQHIPTASATKIIHYTSMDSFAIFAPKVASQAATKSIIRSTGSGLISEGVLSIAENKVIELCP